MKFGCVQPMSVVNLTVPMDIADILREPETICATQLKSFSSKSHKSTNWVVSCSQILAGKRESGYKYSCIEVC